MDTSLSCANIGCTAGLWCYKRCRPHKLRSTMPGSQWLQCFSLWPN